MVKRFAPDLDDLPTLEIPDLRRKAQSLLHLLVSADITPEEYVEKLDIIQGVLKEVYQEAVTLASIQHEWKYSGIKEKMERATQRPPPDPAPDETITVQDLDIDWSDFDDIKD